MKVPADAIDGLRAIVAKAGRPQLLPLDLSYESLDRLEDYLRLVWEKRVSADLDAVIEHVVAYVDATHAKHAPKLKKAIFEPDDPVRGFKATFVGTIRDYAERFDVPLQRRILGDLVSDIGGTLATLRAEVKALNGKEPGAMDGSAGNLAALERALRSAEERDDIMRDQLRRLSRGALVYLGWLVQQRAGAAEWSVQDDERDLRFGWWKIDGWYPEIVVNDVERDDGWLAVAVERQVKKRKKR